MNLWLNPDSNALLVFLLQLFLTLAMCKIVGKILSYIGQPVVIGQIIAGIILGPTVLFHVPNFQQTVFPTSSLPSFELVAQIALILFMWWLGMEVDIELITKSYKTILPMIASSITVPFGIGCAVALWMYNFQAMEQASYIAFILLFGVVFGFSAFPVIVAVLSQLGMLREEIGARVVSLAAGDDVSVWTLLAIASAFATGENPLAGIYTMFLTFGFILGMIFIARPLLRIVHNYFMERGEELERTMIMLCFLVLIASAFTSESLGIQAFLGAFLGGIIVPREGELIDWLSLRVELITIELFLPLFFANSGLSTQLDQLNQSIDWGVLFAIIVCAFAAKFMPIFMMTKFVAKKSSRYSATTAILMNTRGLVQLVVLNVGLSLNILSQKVFSLMVLWAILTTFFVPLLVNLVWKRKRTSSTISNPNTIASDLVMLRRQMSDQLVTITIAPVVGMNALESTNSLDEKNRNALPNSNSTNRRQHDPLELLPRTSVFANGATIVETTRTITNPHHLFTNTDDVYVHRADADILNEASVNTYSNQTSEISEI